MAHYVHLLNISFHSAWKDCSCSRAHASGTATSKKAIFTSLISSHSGVKPPAAYLQCYNHANIHTKWKQLQIGHSSMNTVCPPMKVVHQELTICKQILCKKNNIATTGMISKTIKGCLSKRDKSCLRMTLLTEKIHH